MTRACAVFGCPQPPVSRGRCAKHAGQVDALRSIGSDRQAGAALYHTREWRDLRAAVLALHPFCMCAECVSACRRWPSKVVHHLKPHGGDRARFFDPANLIAMSKACHDKLTASGQGRPRKATDQRPSGTAAPCRASRRTFDVGGSAPKVVPTDAISAYRQDAHDETDAFRAGGMR